MRRSERKGDMRSRELERDGMRLWERSGIFGAFSLSLALPLACPCTGFGKWKRRSGARAKPMPAFHWVGGRSCAWIRERINSHLQQTSSTPSSLFRIIFLGSPSPTHTPLLRSDSKKQNGVVFWLFPIPTTVSTQHSTTNLPQPSVQRKLNKYDSILTLCLQSNMD